MISKNPVVPFFCLIFFCSGLVSAQNDLSDSVLDSLWKSARHQFQKGQYCEVLETIRHFPMPMEGTMMVEKWLLEAECWLEREQSDSAFVRLRWLEDVILTNSIEAGKAQLLKARLSENREDWEVAESLYKEILARKRDSASAEGLYARALTCYGSFLLKREQFEEAERILLEAKSILNGQDLVLAKCYRQLANLYQFKSQYELSKEAFEKAKSIWESNGLTAHPGYALLLNDYSLLYLVKNQLTTYETMLDKAAAITRGACPKPSNEAYHTGARAILRYLLGDYEQAEIQFQYVAKQFQQLGQNKEVANAFNWLGKTSFQMDSLDQAADYFEQALEKVNLVFGKGHKGFTKAIILDGLAQVNDLAGNYELADSLYHLEQQMLEEIMGKENVHYSAAINNQAYFYEAYEQYGQAADLYQQSLEIIDQIYGNRHPDYLTTLYNISRVHARMNTTDAAISYYKKANALQLELLNNYFATYDEQTRMQYRLRALGNFDVFFNYACFVDHPEISTEIQNLLLSTKNLVLDYSIQARRLSLEQDSGTIETLRKEWVRSRKLLSNTYNLGLIERKEYGLSIDSIEQVVNQLERKLVRAYPDRFGITKKVHARDISDRLKKGEASVDFFTFNYFDGYEFYPDSSFYFALVTKPGDAQPRLVYLSNNRQIENILNQYSQYSRNLTAGYELYSLVWRPLEPYLEEVKKVHLSPDGLLYQVSFGGLFIDETDPSRTLLDDYELAYYSNLRDFMTVDKRNQKEKTAVLIGNPAFGPASEKKEERALNNTNGTEPALRGVSAFFPKLTGTEKELQKIDQQLKSQGYTTKVWQEGEASEKQFKDYFLQKAATIVHLATHGYFMKYEERADTLGDRYSDRLRTVENAMVRSGLALANANLVWTGTSIPTGTEDGLLNALEIADLNLSNTKLVVLSACETGLGKITDGEGVFGLQRAFKLAGAGQLLMSLWKVPDALTAELMNYFYAYYLSDGKAGRALEKAQMKMKEKYPPFYWAGFVLFE